MERPPLIDKAKEASKEKRWFDVESIVRDALEETPNSVEALHLMAQCLSNTDRQEEAAGVLKTLLEISPSDRAARLSMASLSWHLGLFEQCAGHCSVLLEDEPENSHLWNSLGLCYMALNRSEDAVPCLEKASLLQPQVFAFKQNLGKAFEKGHRPALAVEAYRQALGIVPRSADCLYGLAKMSFALGNVNEAQKSIDSLAGIRELTTEEQLLRCEILLLSERADEALSYVVRVIESDPNHAGARLIKAVSLQQKGKHEESVLELHAAIEIDPEFPTPYLHLVHSKRFEKSDQTLIDTMLSLSKRTDRRPADIALIHFALGKAYDELEEFERAMKSFDQGHGILKELEGKHFNPEEMRHTIDWLIATFTKASLEQRRVPSLDTELPLFIVGLQRSGTTLTETILSSHSRIKAGGEIPFWDKEAPKVIRTETRLIQAEFAADAANRYLSKLEAMSMGANRVTDKLPSNFQNIGLLHALFPNAHFVHCRRHPADNCLSFYMNMLTGTNFLHDKGDIVFAYRQYARLMVHWRSVLPDDRLFEVDYEGLIADQEGVTRNLIDFCGLEWEDACLYPEKNDRIISTASHWQARQPLYKNSLERWRRYEPWLGEFRELLEAPPPH
jgi:tetratricopeptide (TPR) repeat protein